MVYSLNIFAKTSFCLELRFDPAACGSGLLISEKNTHLKKTDAVAGHRACRTLGAGWTQGAHYWSVRIMEKTSQGYIMIGIVSSEFDTSSIQYVGQTTSSYGFYVVNGHKYHNAAAVRVVPDTDRPNNGDVIGVLLDLDAHTLTYFKNGIQLGTAFSQIPPADNNLKYYPAISCHEAGNWVSLIKTTK